jgi:hypothetical protein
MYGTNVVLLEEVKHQNLRTATEASTCPSEAKENDLLKSDRLTVIANLQNYQEEIRAWRDLKVKL